MKKPTEKVVKKVEIQYAYDHKPTLRRSGMGKGAWEYTVYKFGIVEDPQKVMSITIEGEDDYGHLQLSYIVES